MLIYSAALRYMIHVFAIVIFAVLTFVGKQLGGSWGGLVGMLTSFVICGLTLGTIALLFEIRDNLVQLNTHRSGDDEERPELNRREPQLGR